MWSFFSSPRLVPSCQLEIESEVNFGTLVTNSKVYCKEVHITNHGRVPGKYFLSYKLTYTFGRTLVLFEIYTLSN